MYRVTNARHKDNGFKNSQIPFGAYNFINSWIQKPVENLDPLKAHF